MEHKKLSQLFRESTHGNVYKWHHYLDIYQEFFHRFRDKPLVILEIGILNGGSLHLWRDYFGTQCQVYGIDIDPLAKKYETSGIKIRIGDQSDSHFLENLIKEVGNFDIVIDDGAHTNFMVRSSFISLYKNTRHLYVVEDTQALYWYCGIYSLARDCIYAFTGQKSIPHKIKRLVKILGLWIFRQLSFIKFAKSRADELTKQWHKRPYGEMKSGEIKEINSNDVSEFAKSTKSVHFYDSLIVFEKNIQAMKVVEFR
jgi:hypothetical protein